MTSEPNDYKINCQRNSAREKQRRNKIFLPCEMTVPTSYLRKFNLKSTVSIDQTFETKRQWVVEQQKRLVKEENLF